LVGWLLFYWWILVFINGYYISGYWLVGCYSIGGYWCLLMVIILVAIGWLVVILLVDIGVY
jgi:hypothetical protein